MTDTNPNPTPPDPNQEPDHMKEMRGRAEQLPVAQGLAGAAELKFALYKDVGIDVTTRQGEAWLTTFKGDIGDLDAVRSDWEEFTGAPATAPAPQGDGDPATPPAAQPTDGPAGEGFQTGMTDDLRNNQTGRGVPPAGGAPEPSAYDKSVATQAAALAADAPPDIARQAGIMEIMGAAAQGDKSVLFEGQNQTDWENRQYGG